MTKALVIIPTYNEAQNAENVINEVLKQSDKVEVLIVDDNSPDGTAEIVKKIMESNPRVHLLQRERKLGLGTAYVAGFKYAIEKKFDFVFEMDADFSHNPDDLIRLYEACAAGADVAVGSRYVKGGKVVNWPWDRILISKGGAIYTRVITWMPVKNLSSYIIFIEQTEDKAFSFTAKLPGSVAEFEVPNSFLHPGTEYRLRIGTVTNDGNISFAQTSFVTAKVL